MKNLDKSKEKVELNFWEDQMRKLGNFVNIHMKAVRVYYAYLNNSNNSNSEEMENFLCYASAMLKGAGLNLKAFDRVEVDLDKTEVSEAEGDDQNMDKVEEAKETTMMVKDENKFGSKLDDHSEVVEKVDDVPEACEKENDDNLKESVSLNIYAPKAADIDDNKLCDDLEDTEAEVVSTVNNPTQPEHKLNASFMKEMQIEHDSDETSEDLKGNCDDNNKVVKVVAGNDEDQIRDKNRIRISLKMMTTKPLMLRLRTVNYLMKSQLLRLMKTLRKPYMVMMRSQLKKIMNNLSMK